MPPRLLAHRVFSVLPRCANQLSGVAGVLAVHVFEHGSARAMLELLMPATMRVPLASTCTSTGTSVPGPPMTSTLDHSAPPETRAIHTSMPWEEEAVAPEKAACR